ncbi:hypothetical protein SAMN04488556_1857 [Halostagnicola kamekurae]|uniref:Uncharacterized protein n=1 Tax=Halostagnicola kamekurae TaxID=619731 RepID=A0A1I6RKG2_9EURY|nr:hypothetical protein SAMN04488556_1857 [Halostagnicola kamekurae]
MLESVGSSGLTGSSADDAAIPGPEEQYHTEKREDHSTGSDGRLHARQKRNGCVPTEDERDDGESPQDHQPGPDQREANLTFMVRA